MPKQISLQQPLKLFVANIHLPKTSWKAEDIQLHTFDSVTIQ